MGNVIPLIEIAAVISTASAMYEQVPCTAIHSFVVAREIYHTHVLPKFLKDYLFNCGEKDDPAHMYLRRYI